MIAGITFPLYLSSLSQLEAQLLVFLDYYYHYYYCYYYYNHHHHHDHHVNELAMVDVIQTLHQRSEPYPMAKGPLGHSFSFTFPTTFLRSLLFPTKVFSAAISP